MFRRDRLLVAVTLLAAACSSNPAVVATSTTMTTIIATTTTTSAPTVTTTSASTTTTTAPVELVPPTITPLQPTPPEMQLSLNSALPPDAADVETRLVSVTRGGPGLVAVGVVGAPPSPYGDAAVLVSSDGRTWDRLPNQDDVFDSDRLGYHNKDQWMADITAWQGGFVAVGSDGQGQNSVYDAAVWLSDDGITWNRVPHQASLSAPPSKPGWPMSMNAVTVGGPGLVAAAGGEVWLSEDGHTWTAVDLSMIEGALDGTHRTPPGWGGIAINDVAAAGPGLVAVGTDDYFSSARGLNGGDPAAWTSTDGLKWDEILLDDGSSGRDANSMVRRLAVSPSGMIAAVGSVGDIPNIPHHFAAVWLSQDGFDWQLVGVFDDPDYSTCAGAAIWDGDTLIVAGTARNDRPDYEPPDGESRVKAAIIWATPDFGETWYEIARAPYEQPEGVFTPISWGPGFTLDFWADAMSDIIIFDSQIVATGFGTVWYANWPPD